MQITVRQMIESDKTLKISNIHSRPTSSGVKTHFTVKRGHGPSAKVVIKLATFDQLISA